jgi:trehalose 6-phosphate phosphatase
MAKALPIIARDWALFLDVDGTLLDFVSRPDAATVPPSLPPILTALSAELGGALAIISGRTIADLDRLFAPLRLPAAGQHGAEVRRDERTCVLAPHSPALASILEPVYALGERRLAIIIENKGLSAAIHYAEAGPERAALNEILPGAIARSDGAFQLLASHLAFDIVPHAVDKGRAIDWFMAVAPFAGRVPVFIGDDRTDEDGFAAVAARGGHTIQVGARGNSIARWHVQTPQELRAWLERSLATLERSR